jgi:hypothetical protein
LRRSILSLDIFFLENGDRPTFMNEGRAMEQADYGPPADSVSAGKGLKTPAVKVREDAEGSSATQAYEVFRCFASEVIKGVNY